MATSIIVPVMGESVTEATIAKWLKSEGDMVAVDEPLVELETDKITLEVPAPEAGVLSEIKVKAGDVVEVGAVLGTIDAKAMPKKTNTSQKDQKQSSAEVNAKVQAAQPQKNNGGQAALSPAVRKIVEEKQLDPKNIAGTGKDGRLTKGDLLNVSNISSQNFVPSSQSRQNISKQMGREQERVPMTRLRKKIAERLKMAQNNAAILTTFNEVDMTQIMAIRARYKDVFEKKRQIKLGFMSFFVKSCLVALKEFPMVNAEIDGDDIVYKNFYDIGVAVGTEQGLVVPIIRDADQKSFADLEMIIAEFGTKAREGKLTLEELTGGTFTISNGGVYGSLMSTPILNPPQSGILGMHKTMMRPMAIDGKVEIRPMMYVALSYDHRIVDGREAVSFLVRVKECLEDPQRLLLDL
ncbi:MAG: 2-oxoglutarate dehydrogenase complex dihydrolipoyllysine-residue succinyltransferase [Alphaproteobacteria bacterium]|nr:2-oxoglutarate dehydrogenase complex dihydrolipoyllysine-residue succinyltransferase [Alphaproteobacteria bacterium]